MSERCSNHSEFFPCYERDGEDALDSKWRCVGCGASMDEIEMERAVEALEWRSNKNTEALFSEIAALRARVLELEGLAGIVGELGDSAKMLMYGLREWEYMGCKITETGSWIDLADAVNWYNEAGVYAILAGGGKGEDRG